MWITVVAAETPSMTTTPTATTPAATTPSATTPTCCTRPMRRMTITSPTHVQLTLHLCGRCDNREWLADGHVVGRDVVLKVAATFRTNKGKRTIAA